MRIAVYPGTFDPITFGHLDIVERASEIFDKVYVSIGVNPAKKPLFTVDERKRFISNAVTGYKNVEVADYSGLLVEHARKLGAMSIIRGLRAISDFDYEFQLALMNRKLAGNISTVFLMPHEKYTYLNSSIIRSLSELGQDVSEFVPAAVADALTKKFKV